MSKNKRERGTRLFRSAFIGGTMILKKARGWQIKTYLSREFPCKGERGERKL